MRIPDFKPSQDFLGDTGLACLYAKVKNSELPGVAFEHIAECNEDPDCEIYLRGRKEAQISPWHQEILDQLLTKGGLIPAVTEAMKEYESGSKWGGKDYAELGEEDCKKIRQHGIAPHITISVIVIDEIKRKVILRADTIIDGNLDEHGISIYQSKGRWRFDTSEYFDQYQSSVLGTGNQREEYAKRQWDKLYPTPIDLPEETDWRLIIGDWVMNEPETQKLMKAIKMEPEIARLLVSSGQEKYLSVGPDCIRMIKTTPPSDIYEREVVYRVIECKRRGNRITLRELRLEEDESRQYELIGNYWSDGQTLVCKTGIVYRRKVAEA